MSIIESFKEYKRQFKNIPQLYYEGYKYLINYL